MIYLAFDRFWNNTPVAGHWYDEPNPWGPLPIIAELVQNFPTRYALAHVTKLLEADVRFAYVLKWRYYYGYGTGLTEEKQEQKVQHAFAWLIGHPVLPALRNGKARLVFIDWWEGEIEQPSATLSSNNFKFQALAKFLNIPIKAIIFAHGNANAEAEAQKPDTPSFVYENVFQHTALNDMRAREKQGPAIKEHPLDKPYRFLSYSRHWNEYRQYLTLEYFARGLDEFGLISCGAGGNQDLETDTRSLLSMLPHWVETKAELELLAAAVPAFMQRLPLTLDHDLSINLVHYITYEHFLQTDLSIVNETWANDRTVFVSEKIFKTMSLKHPFLLMGNPGTLAHLRELGYKTFWPYLDESYDDEKHLPTRKNKLLRVLTDFCNLSRDHRLELRHRLDEITNFNYEHLKQADVRNIVGKNLTNFLSNIFEKEYLGAV